MNDRNRTGDRNASSTDIALDLYSSTPACRFWKKTDMNTDIPPKTKGTCYVQIRAIQDRAPQHCQQFKGTSTSQLRQSLLQNHATVSCTWKWPGRFCSVKRTSLRVVRKSRARRLACSRSDWPRKRMAGAGFYTGKPQTQRFWERRRRKITRGSFSVTNPERKSYTLAKIREQSHLCAEIETTPRSLVSMKGNLQRCPVDVWQPGKERALDLCVESFRCVQHRWENSIEFDIYVEVKLSRIPIMKMRNRRKEKQTQGRENNELPIDFFF